MGIEGAALATTTARVVMAISIMVYIWRDKQVRSLRREFIQDANPALSYIKPILVIVSLQAQFFWEVAAFNAGQEIMSGWISMCWRSRQRTRLIGLASITFTVIYGSYQLRGLPLPGTRMALKTKRVSALKYRFYADRDIGSYFCRGLYDLP
jgi:hypothetical protein